MATYVNDLRLKEIATGDESGTWGTSTNTNLELIADAFSYATKDCFATDADATETMADGVADEIRSLYLKVTSSATLTATRTLTLAPNTVSKTWIIENATTGGQSISISQGSGANVTIPNGDTKIIYTDGAGAGAAVTDAFANLNVGDLTATNIAGTLSTAAQPNITSVGTLTGFTSTGIDDNADATAITIDSSENVTFTGTGQATRLGLGVAPHATAALSITTTDQHIRLNNGAELGIIELDSDGKINIWAHGDGETINLKTGTGSGTDVLSVVGNNVGIGTTSIDEKLHVQVASGDAALKLEDATSYMRIDQNSIGADTVLRFKTGSSLDERMRIDSSGNVGIGTTTSGHPLAVQATSATNPQLHFETSAYGNAYGTKILVASTNEAGTTSSFYNLYKTTASVNGRSDVQQHLSFVGSSAASDYQYWSTGGSERMRIDGSGNVGIGTTSPSGKLHVNTGANTTEGAPHLRLEGAGYSGFHFLDGTAYYIGQNSAGRALRIYSSAETAGVNLAAGGTSWGTFSDERLKENIQDIGSVIEKIKDIRCVTYNRKDVDDENKIETIGFIAQDFIGKFDQVLDESKVLDSDEETRYSIKYTETIPVLLKAIQEQQTIIESLEARITALES